MVGEEDGSMYGIEECDRVGSSDDDMCKAMELPADRNMSLYETLPALSYQWWLEGLQSHKLSISYFNAALSERSLWLPNNHSEKQDICSKKMSSPEPIIKNWLEHDSCHSGTDGW